MLLSESSLSDWSQILSLPVASIALVFALAAVIMSIKAARLSAYFSIKSLVTQYNERSLESDENLDICDAIQFPEYKHQSIATKRKRWLAFHALNSHEAFFVTHRQKILRGHYHEHAWVDRLARVCDDPEIEEWLVRGGYDPQFILFIKTIKAKTGRSE